MIAVVDYGASNVPSVLRGLRAVQADAAVTADPETVRRAPRVVVPGVGNFAPAMRRLVAAGLADAVREVARSGRPVLGICLGLQLLLESSDEAPGVPGLGLLAGRGRRFPTDPPVPHVGWAKVTLTERGRAHAALRRAFPGGDAFFYHVRSEEHTSELQSPCNLVCRLLLEKKKTKESCAGRAGNGRRDRGHGKTD